jgi:D-alanine-D-alanine ligase
MKIAIIYNRDSQAVINLFGIPNREKYGLETVERIKNALEQGGHQVKAFEGDKNIVAKLEEFMPAVISGERPGLVFNLSYGIQGRARYTHIPGILEMLGVPYVGSGPETHAIALDKVVTKMILSQKGLPTPRYAVLEHPDSPMSEKLKYPLIVKPKDEAVSFGLRIVRSEGELREGAWQIYNMFKAPTLVEEYVDGREINVALLGNDPVEALPPVELVFGEGEKIYTYEDKIISGSQRVQKVCPAPLSAEETERIQGLAIDTFKALGCFDSARVDFRLDSEGNPYILEVNTMASLGPGGSFVFAADKVGIHYDALTNRLIEIASSRYFGTALDDDSIVTDDKGKVFAFLTKNRDNMEEELKNWTNLPSWTDDAVGLGTVVRKVDNRMQNLGLLPVERFTNRRSAWTWETPAGMEGGTLLVTPVDIPRDRGQGYPVPYRLDPEWLSGEGIASSRAGLICLLQSLAALADIDGLNETKLGVFVYSDEGRGMRYSGPVLQQAAAKAKQVLILQPGLLGGKVVDQRRGSRKFSILAEGNSLRPGYRGNQDDPLSWFLKKTDDVSKLNKPEDRLTVAIQELQSERYGVLLPHRIRATVYLTYLDTQLADDAEKVIRDTFSIDHLEIRAYAERLEKRPALNRSDVSAPVLQSLQAISEEWKLPFGVDSNLLPSASGVVPAGIPVVCGLGPAGRDIFTPYESVHRGELLQRALLLTLYLLEE